MVGDRGGIVKALGLHQYHLQLHGGIDIHHFVAAFGKAVGLGRVIVLPGVSALFVGVLHIFLVVIAFLGDCLLYTSRCV